VGPLFKVRIGYLMACSHVIKVASFEVRNICLQFKRFIFDNSFLNLEIVLFAKGLSVAFKIVVFSLSMNPNPPILKLVVMEKSWMPCFLKIFFKIVLT